MTIRSIRIEQPDIIDNGYLFSLTLIYFVNIIIVVFVLKIVFPEINIKTFFSQTAGYLKNIAVFLFAQGQKIAAKISL